LPGSWPPWHKNSGSTGSSSEVTQQLAALQLLRLLLL
jgi:hypothetical protein